ncbi:hypothetical protein NDU88_006599 [Pleurodeles waltl]|uniref:Uncharacterized protein n=1 Tax=Pleurodeles waltl TaxID=8319 RepID=A0AAV7MDB5_PLEWA|nr:hypothetical protein NDU88_006599 [Pleurodeles waltl]
MPNLGSRPASLHSADASSGLTVPAGPPGWVTRPQATHQLSFPAGSSYLSKPPLVRRELRHYGTCGTTRLGDATAGYAPSFLPGVQIQHTREKHVRSFERRRTRERTAHYAASVLPLDAPRCLSNAKVGDVPP